jgi:aryl-alcohol dehydrogenase (NADP+)
MCLGTLTFGHQADEATAFDILDAGVEGGITFFDSADVYPSLAPPEFAGASETILGRWLADRGGRDRFVIATKVYNRTGPGPNDLGLGRKHLIAACEASLRRLQTDYLDLYQTHAFDTTVPLEETLRALDDLVTAGKVRYIGTSNHKAWQLADANWTSQLHGLATYASVQHRYNILYRAIEDEVVPACASLGVAILPWNPLAGGLLTSAYANRRMADGNRFDLPGGRGEMYRQRYWNEATLDEVDRILEVVTRHGHSLTHVALQWVANRPGVTSLLISAETQNQVRDTIAALAVTLSDEEQAACDEAWFNMPRARDLGVPTTQALNRAAPSL